MQGVSIRMFARASQARMHHRGARTQRPCPAVSVAAASLPSRLCPPLGRGVGQGHHTIRFCQQTQAHLTPSHFDAAKAGAYRRGHNRRGRRLALASLGCARSLASRIRRQNARGTGPAVRSLTCAPLRSSAGRRWKVR
jgi:hypothetical protein